MRPSIVRLLAVLLLAPCPALAATLHVCPDGSGEYRTLQAAVDAAAGWDEIELCDGVFAGPGNRDVVVPVPLTFRGPAAIDCRGSETENHRAFSLEADCTFRDLLIRNGYAARGGAIYAADRVVATIRGCTFEDNIARQGGALAFDTLDRGGAARPEEVHVEDSTFLRNHAKEDCGVVYVLALAIRFDGCRFLENTARYGGVCDFVHARLDFADCLLEGNRAEWLGGAISMQGPATFTRCTFVGNSAPDGAHIHVNPWESELEVVSSILAYGEGGGAVTGCYPGEPMPSAFTCCDLFGNAGGDFVGCAEGAGAIQDNFSADPLFCHPAANDYRLRPGSPCAPEQNPGCGRVGALEVGCGLTAVRPSSWGLLKAMHRREP